MSRAIYFVANKPSQNECLNAVYALRSSGCTLPICLIPFGGEPVDSAPLLEQVEILPVDSFPQEAQALLDRVAALWPETYPGLYRRILCWFGPYEEFIYSDNDVVPLMNWEHLFPYLDGYDVVHSDHEYKTNLKFNTFDPPAFKALLGEHANEQAFTSGHLVSRKFDAFQSGIESAIEWVKAHPELLIHHDQSFLIVASLLGQWKVLNLCKAPHNWLSPWAGHYERPLEIIQKIQAGGKIAHLHYSGWSPDFISAREELALSYMTDRERLAQMTRSGLAFFSGWRELKRLRKRLRQRLKQYLK